MLFRWDMTQSESLRLRDVENGLQQCGISSTEAVWVLLIDIIMDGNPTIVFAEFADAMNMLARKLDNAAIQNVADATRQEAVSFVKDMHSDKMKRWGMLPCSTAAGHHR